MKGAPSPEPRVVQPGSPVGSSFKPEGRCWAPTSGANAPGQALRVSNERLLLDPGFPGHSSQRLSCTPVAQPAERGPEVTSPRQENTLRTYCSPSPSHSSRV
ncbi:hypothetical protein H1C71_032802 [Ictidomys tridecemlineatus]|nr:hypothetical protein H1C71_032802 [Ictidomys tridecemlineatus]